MTNTDAIGTLKANYPDACYRQLREAVDAAIEALKVQDKTVIEMKLADANELKNITSDIWLLDRINELPIEVEPVIHGKWIKMNDAEGTYYACSECGNELPRINSFDPQFDLFPKLKSIDKTAYCSHCGAKMENANG